MELEETGNHRERSKMIQSNQIKKLKETTGETFILSENSMLKDRCVLRITEMRKCKEKG